MQHDFADCTALCQECASRGCQTLNQLQLLVRIGCKAESVPELFLLRPDEQGLDVSSPWEISGEDSIVGTLWPKTAPKLCAAWLNEEQWAGC